MACSCCCWYCAGDWIPGCGLGGDDPEAWPLTSERLLYSSRGKLDDIDEGGDEIWGEPSSGFGLSGRSREIGGGGAGRAGARSRRFCTGGLGAAR